MEDRAPASDDAITSPVPTINTTPQDLVETIMRTGQREKDSQVALGNMYREMAKGWIKTTKQ
jgi:hypothetical protein